MSISSKREEAATNKVGSIIDNLVYYRGVDKKELYNIMHTDERFKRFCNERGMDLVRSDESIANLADAIEKQITGENVHLSMSDVNDKRANRAYSEILSFVRSGISISESACTWLEYIA